MPGARLAEIGEPFLTEMDERGAIRGSVDGLGAMRVWTSIGRTVVGNLTTVTTSVRDFTVTMLGHHLAGEVAAVRPSAKRLDTFLKWEQLAAHVRAHCNRDFALRGTQRVQQSLAEGLRITLGVDRKCQFLVNQRM